MVLALGPLPDEALGGVGELLDVGTRGSVDPARFGALCGFAVAETASCVLSFCTLFFSPSWQGGLWPCRGGTEGGASWFRRCSSVAVAACTGASSVGGGSSAGEMARWIWRAERLGQGSFIVSNSGVLRRMAHADSTSVGALLLPVWCAALFLLFRRRCRCWRAAAAVVVAQRSALLCWISFSGSSCLCIVYCTYSSDEYTQV